MDSYRLKKEVIMKLNFPNKYFYPLLENGFSDSDIRAGINVLLNQSLLQWVNIHKNLKNILQKV